MMWGQDLYHFLHQDGALAFTADFWTNPHPLWRLLIMPQAWTLSLEFSFYLIAPFVVRRAFRSIALILMASLALRLLLQLWLCWHGDPWSYRFFPSELALFLLGTLGYPLPHTGQRSIIALTVRCRGVGSRRGAADQ
jgi:peptidoglycan/LPS O-acetylase OafA/YrhL